jgi:hypothetical protein
MVKREEADVAFLDYFHGQDGRRAERDRASPDPRL